MRRHHCPFLPTRIYEKVHKPRNSSEYTENYQLYHNILPVVSCKPAEDYQKGPAHMDAKSTFRTDYVPHDVRARKPKKRAEYEPRTERMDLNSTYKLDYSPYGDVRPVSSFKPVQGRTMCPVMMDGLSTYRGDYKKWQEAKRESLKPRNVRESPGLFDNTTTCHDDYQFRGIPVTKSFKPSNVARISTTPMEHESNYRKEYIPFRLERREVREKAQYKPSDIPFDTLTTHRKDFRGSQGEAAKLIRPCYFIPKRDVPFSDSTEFQDQYKAWPNLPAQPRKMAAYIPPEEKMDCLSTHARDFKEFKVKPRSPFIPLVSIKKSAPFDNNSTMKEDYRFWQYNKPEMIKPKQQWLVPKDPFDDVTTFRRDYTEKPCPFTTSCKPPAPPPRSFIPLDAHSTYAISYTPKQIHKCPASYKDPPGYIYEETDSAGHKLYRYVSKQDSPRLESARVSEAILPEKTT
uniref:Stabilizer of axonemal microtubules 1 n=1 Tax=Geotrypetes seraphini TaxID=260995 RepID=A0A6P8SLT8_GEOSA|nr:stabilizer of axonemal microtubules 1 [Geotrypetes seraphini]